MSLDRPYLPQAWVDENEPGETAITAARLNHMEDGIAGALRPRVDGPVHFQPDVRLLFPQQYEPAGTNLLPNPSFEVDLAGWPGTTYGTAPTLTRVTTDGRFGTSCMEATWGTTATFDGVRSAYVSAQPGETVTGSVWVKAVSGATAFRLAVEAHSGSATMSNVNASFTATATWARHSVSHVMPAGATRATLNFDDGGGSAAMVLRFDGFQVERGPVATSYIDGSLGTGFAWTGAPHASTSTRVADTVPVLVTDAATTNLLPNPSFEGVGGWEANNVTPPPVFSYRESSDSRFGTRVGRLDLPGGGPFQAMQSNTVIAASAGTTYAGSCFVRGTPGKRMTLYLAMTVNGSFSSDEGNGARVLLTGDWQRISTRRLAPTGTTTVGLILTNDSSVGDQGAYFVEVDGAQLEAGVGTSYADGSLGTGYAWTGTPHASTSTRAAGTVIAPEVKTPPPYGVVVEQAGRNLVHNPRFETGLDYWTFGRTVASAMRLLHSRATSPIGSGALRIETDAVAGGALRRVLHDRVLAKPNTSYVLSAWVRGNVNAVFECLRYTDGGTLSGAGFGIGVIPTSGTWQRVARRFVTAADTMWLAPEPGIHNDVTTAGFVEICGVQLEEGDAATSYIDGSLGPGYGWEGTPHASPSRRKAGMHVLGREGIRYEKAVAMRAHRLGALTVPTGAGTAVPLNGESLDTDGFHDPAVNPSRCVVPPGRGGVYRIFGQVTFVAGSATTRRVSNLRVVSGSTVIFVGESNVQGTTPTQTTCTSSSVERLADGDYVELIAYQESGAALDVAAGDRTQTYMTMERIGD